MPYIYIINKKEMRIRIFSDTLNSLQWKEKYESSCFSGFVDYYKEQKAIEFVSDETYTHAILLDQVIPDLLVPRENVVGMSLQCKPRWKKDFVLYAKENINKYYVGDDTDVEFLGNPFVKHFSFVPYCLPLHTIGEKTRVMSITVFDKRFSLGNYYCNKIVELIVENNIPIDIFGKTEKDYRGTKSKTGGSNLFSLKESYMPTDPYEKYGFSIVIEENKSNAFFSDRLITSMICQSVPIYFGCDSLGKIEENAILLTGNLAKDMNVIVDILKKPEYYYKDINIDKLDKRMNLLRNAKKLFS